MKPQLRAYLSGVLTTALILGTAVTALAVSGTVSFNRSPIKFNGEIISAAGEGYTLSNGCEAPASITYTDEKGGGTTYLPARRIAELMGVGIDWDPATGAVTVTGNTVPAVPDTPVPTPDTATLPDYSDWSAEDEAAYQEFKGMWETKKTSYWISNLLIVDTNDFFAFADKIGYSTMEKILYHAVTDAKDQFHIDSNHFVVGYTISVEPECGFECDLTNGEITVHFDLDKMKATLGYLDAGY